MKARLMIAVALTLTAVAVAAAQSGTRWVDRTKADVRAGKASFHEVVDTVLKGEQVQILKSEERWLSVRTPRGKTGWLFEQALSATAVTPGRSDFLKMVPGGDASTSATAASTGAKGVYAEQYARDKGYDFDVVRWIESHQPTARDAETFAKSGAGR
ncbi:MAG: SH3 domain-containing protein [Candidatus Rokubacteria bacterium]|nr:SH3 domain-containing protein [Candidatus Rokubacteria bacterium]